MARYKSIAVALGSLLFIASSAGALPIPNADCHGYKAKAVAKSFSCGLKMGTAQALRVAAVDISRCTAKQAYAFERAESRSVCAVVGDAAAARDLVRDAVEEMLTAMEANAAVDSNEVRCVLLKSRIMMKYAGCRVKFSTGVFRNDAPLLLDDGECEWDAYDAFSDAQFDRGTCVSLDNIYDLIPIPGASTGYLPGLSVSGYDFARGNLRGMVLTGADFSGSDLDQAQLANARLAGASFAGASLVEASLYGVDASLADMSDVDATSAELWYGNYSNANLRAAILTGSNLSFADLSGADLTGALLDGADFDGADLAGVSLSAFDPSQFSAALLAACPASLPAEWQCLSNTLVGPGAELAGQTLSGSNWNGANLEGAKLGSTDLDDVSLVAANLIGTDFRFADLTNANLSGSDLSGADFTGATLAGTNLSASNLSGVNLSSADLADTNLVGATFAPTDMSWARVQGATLTGIDLTAVPILHLSAHDLTQCPAALPPAYICERGAILGPSVALRGVDLSGGNFGAVDLRDASLSLSNLSGANLAGANLTGAYFPASSVGETDLSHANLSGAILADADASGSNMRGASLMDADLHGANLRGVEFRDADLTNANLSGADMRVTWWSNTICPDGTNSNANGASCCGHHVGGAPAFCSKKPGT